MNSSWSKGQVEAEGEVIWSWLIWQGLPGEQTWNWVSKGWRGEDLIRRSGGLHCGWSKQLTYLEQRPGRGR